MRRVCKQSVYLKHLIIGSLLTYLSRSLLITKESIVLYVGHENPAAKVYKRVGFAGLLGAPPVKGVDSWLEVGFDPKCVVMGHW